MEAVCIQHGLIHQGEIASAAIIPYKIEKPLGSIKALAYAARRKSDARARDIEV
jgi:hypothetical protein